MKIYSCKNLDFISTTASSTSKNDKYKHHTATDKLADDFKGKVLYNDNNVGIELYKEKEEKIIIQALQDFSKNSNISLNNQYFDKAVESILNEHCIKEAINFEKELQAKEELNFPNNCLNSKTDNDSRDVPLDEEYFLDY